MANIVENRGKRVSDGKFDFIAVDNNGYVYSNINGTPLVSLNGVIPTSIGQGRKTVTACGTPEKLIATPVSCQYVMAKAISTNAGTIVLGGSGVIASASTRKGFPLSVVSGSSESITIPIDDVSKIYADCTTPGEGVVFTYM